MRRPRYDVPEWGDASGNNHEYQVKKILVRMGYKHLLSYY